jgi:hypothetical protein
MIIEDFTNIDEKFNGVIKWVKALSGLQTVVKAKQQFKKVYPYAYVKYVNAAPRGEASEMDKNMPDCVETTRITPMTAKFDIVFAAKDKDEPTAISFVNRFVAAIKTETSLRLLEKSELAFINCSFIRDMDTHNKEIWIRQRGVEVGLSYLAVTKEILDEYFGAAKVEEIKIMNNIMT